MCRPSGSSKKPYLYDPRRSKLDGLGYGENPQDPACEGEAVMPITGLASMTVITPKLFRLENRALLWSTCGVMYGVCKCLEKSSHDQEVS